MNGLARGALVRTHHGANNRCWVGVRSDRFAVELPNVVPLDALMAATWLNDVLVYSTPSINSGVASNAVFCTPESRCQERHRHATSTLATLAGVICSSGEYFILALLPA